MSNRAFFLGINSWYVNCTDISPENFSQSMNSETRTFIFDNETPEITLEFPANLSLNYTNINFNWTVTDNFIENFT